MQLLLQPQLQLQLQLHPQLQPQLQPPQEPPQFPPPQEPPQFPPPQELPQEPQQQHSTRMTMIHRQELLFPLLKHISNTSLKDFGIFYAPGLRPEHGHSKII